METIYNKMHERESVGKKLCNADQIAIINSPEVVQIRENWARMIKLHPEVQMTRDFSERDNSIYMSFEWSAEDELDQTIIVADEFRVAGWKKALQDAGVQGVVLPDKPREFKQMALNNFQQLKQARVVIITPQRTKTLAILLSQRMSVVPDQQERLRHHELQDILAQEDDLSIQHIQRIRELRRELKHVLVCNAGGVTPQFICRRRVVQGHMPQRVIYDTALGNVEKRIYAKFTWIQHVFDMQYARNKFAMEIKQQIAGTTNQTLELNLYPLVWSWVLEHAIVSQRTIHFMRGQVDALLKQNYYVSPYQQQQDGFRQLALLEDEESIIGSMPSIHFLRSPSELPDLYKDSIIPLAVALGKKINFLSVSQNCSDIVFSRHRAQCMICYSEMEKCSVVYCCCCFVSCAGCFKNVVSRGRIQNNDVQCPQCRQSVMSIPVPARTLFHGPSSVDQRIQSASFIPPTTFSLVAVIPTDSFSSRPKTEIVDEASIIRDIKALSSENHAIVTPTYSQQLFDPGNQSASVFTVPITVNDITNFSVASGKPGEQAYSEFTVHAAAAICHAVSKRSSNPAGSSDLSNPRQDPLQIEFAIVIAKTQNSHKFSIFSNSNPALPAI